MTRKPVVAERLNEDVVRGAIRELIAEQGPYDLRMVRLAKCLKVSDSYLYSSDNWGLDKVTELMRQEGVKDSVHELLCLIYKDQQAGRMRLKSHYIKTLLELGLRGTKPYYVWRKAYQKGLFEGTDNGFRLTKRANLVYPQGHWNHEQVK